MTGAHAGQTLEIRTGDDLAKLLASGTRFRGIALRVPALPAAERRSWEARLAHDYGGCGCDTQPFFMLLGTVATGALSFGLRAGTDASWLVVGAAALATMTIFAAIGMVVGRWRARRRLCATIAAVADRLRLAATESDPCRCVIGRGRSPGAVNDASTQGPAGLVASD
jgi:hypothetical protein